MHLPIVYKTKAYQGSAFSVPVLSVGSPSFRVQLTTVLGCLDSHLQGYVKGDAGESVNNAQEARVRELKALSSLDL